MLRLHFTVTLALFSTFAFAAPASADNQTQIEELKIEAVYDACTADKAQNVEYCATETWSIEISETGWRATGTGTDGAPPVLEMSATCEDGKYKILTNGQPWSGTCKLMGSSAHPCFHVSGGSDREAMKIESNQCFEIVDLSCAVELDGTIEVRSGDVKGEYAIALKELKSCRIVD